MRINLRLLVAFLAFVVSVSLQAAVQQEKRISGTVISDGEPLPGVSVQVKGATTGTITDIDGKYSISAPADGILVFRFVGLKTAEKPVNGRSTIDVTLESDSKELDEVMVVAYATAKKYSFTGDNYLISNAFTVKDTGTLRRLKCSYVRFVQSPAPIGSNHAVSRTSDWILVHTVSWSEYS